jgi:hypothetical protein
MYETAMMGGPEGLMIPPPAATITAPAPTMPTTVFRPPNRSPTVSHLTILSRHSGGTIRGLACAEQSADQGGWAPEWAPEETSLGTVRSVR